MKKIIAATSVILILTLFYYPVFDDKNVSFVIIFVCFAVLIFSVAKLYSPGKKDYELFEKEMDRQHEFDGIFQYTNEGFCFEQNNETEFIKWDEIISVYSFTIPSPFAERQSGLEIITAVKSYEFDEKVTSGIVKLEDQLYNNLSDWEMDWPTVKMNNYGLKKTLLFEKKNF
ncbi:hypothetical protein [Chryseobacterium aureum]|uniref:hypothetical protein n=1 Tax=Chryseobacterium aureum TaxID=2497456 RepID=UPI000F890565|nr:hypothetical protein [Chryseobacterium aureum]